MIESGTLGQKLYRGMILAVCGVFLCFGAWAQSDDAPVPLGDVARSLRKEKKMTVRKADKVFEKQGS